MRPLDLDFQPRRLSAPGLALLLAGLLAASAVALDYRDAAEDAGFWQGELARLQQSARGRLPPRAGDERELQQAAQAAGGVAREIQRPWEALFAALEEAKTEEVALLALEPEAGRGVVRIGGEAKRREAILGYMQRLEQTGALKNVFLAQDQLQQQDPEKPYRFLISAEWAGAVGS